MFIKCELTSEPAVGLMWKFFVRTDGGWGQILSPTALQVIRLSCVSYCSTIFTHQAAFSLHIVSMQQWLARAATALGVSKRDNWRLRKQLFCAMPFLWRPCHFLWCCRVHRWIAILYCYYYHDENIAISQQRLYILLRNCLRLLSRFVYNNLTNFMEFHWPS